MRDKSEPLPAPQPERREIEPAPRQAPKTIVTDRRAVPPERPPIVAKPPAPAPEKSPPTKVLPPPPTAKSPTAPPTPKSPAPPTAKAPPAPPAPATESEAPPTAPAVQAKQVPAKAAAASPTPPAVTTGTTTGTTSDPEAAPPSAKTPPDVQAKAAANAPAIVLEAEQLAARDAGPPGPDYANAPRRPRRTVAEPRPEEPPPPTRSIPGGPLAIPGAKVDLEAKRVDRFLPEGGTALSGRVLDADTGRPVDTAEIEAWMGTKSIHAATDASGGFGFDGLVPGSRITLWITATAKYVQERIEVGVPNDKPRMELTFKLLPRAAAGGQAGGIGVFLSRRGGRTVVSGLDAFGPAERAGVAIGDAIVAIGDRPAADLGPGAIEYLLRGTIGADVEVTVASGGKGPPRKLTLKRSAR